MKYAGNLRKMFTQYSAGQPIEYSLKLEGETVLMNKLLDKNIRLSFEGRINCVSCNKITKKAFGQGFCYKCFMESPMNAECIIRPELCEAHLGKGRDPEWEKQHHLQPHYVYLALSSGIKVGVTREDQIPTRWIDQGASQGIKLAYTENRHEAGLIEVAIKEYVSDKTAWQRMLKNEIATDIDLLDKKEELGEYIPEPLQDFYSEDDEITELNYPVIQFPTKVKSINLERTPEIEGKLMGIKGQYLIFEDQRVINIRKYSGYWVELDV